MKAEDIQQCLARGFPGARIAVADSTGTGDHFSVAVVSPAFQGKTLVERHQLVYAALATLMPHIHALQLRTTTPEEPNR